VIRLVAAVSLAVVLFPAPATAPAAAPRGTTYSPPLPALDVIRPFDPPATRYGAGHLGVDLAAHPGEPVRAAAAGVVTFAGPVAGRGLVVLLHADGVRTEYEPMRVLVSRGASVRAGAVLGRVSGTHGDCAPGRCLHWGARRGADYLDPLLLLRALGTVRLLPWAGPP
jgi:murein DD-endopeptidase MepM/ murein hydrolase activator NlpD